LNNGTELQVQSRDLLSLRWKLILLCTVASLLGATVLGARASDPDFERQRAEMQAKFQQMRNEHRANMTPQGREFLDKMEADSRARQAQQRTQLQNQIDAARRVTVLPSQCALAFNAAVFKATKFADIQPFFSRHYLSVYLNRKSGAELQQELADMKRAYMYDCKARGTDRIESNGESKVWLEGFNSSHTKGTWVNLRMIPEGNYWRIDGYDAQTGLNVIQIPKTNF